MQNMLDSHPDIVGGPEFLHLPDIMELRGKLLASVQIGWIDEFCSASEVDRHIRCLVESLLLPLADRHKCTLLSEKTPFNVLVFSDLLQLFPSARCIHVVRDPRAIVSSMLQVGKRARVKGWQTQSFTTDIAAAIDQAQTCLDRGFEAERTTPDRVLTVVYERLVNDPQTEAKRICDLLCLPWSEQMLRPADQKHLGEKAVTKRSAEVWYDMETYYRNPDAREIEKWRSLLSSRQQAAINMAFRDDTSLEALGYEFGPRRSGVTQLLVAWRLSVLRAGSLGNWARRRLVKARRGLRSVIRVGRTSTK